VTDAERLARIEELQQRIAELRARLPRHTPPTAMMVELDELEDELARVEEEGQKR
jgi:hypothetical protein